MGIGSAKAKAVDTSHHRLSSGDLKQVLIEAKALCFQLKFLAGLGVVQQGRDLTVLKTEQNFDQAAHPCRAQEMPNIRFDRTQHRFGTDSSKNRVQGLGLNRISERGSCAVGLDQGDLRRV